MKKVLLVLGVISTVGMISCGGEEEKEGEDKGIGVCDCMELSEKMMDMEDMEEMEAFSKEHKDEFEACEKLGKEMGEEEAMKAAKDC